MKDFVNLDPYPVDRPDSPTHDVILAMCCARLAAEGMFDLPGFLRPEALQAATEAVKPAMAKQCFRQPALHPMARVNVQASRAGEALNRHFDRLEFTTTILLQAPEAGRELEYRRDLRSPADPNDDGVAAVLRGEDPQVRRQALQPGALNVFRGIHRLHRGVPVQGPTERIVAIFSFLDRPGVVMTASEQTRFYGRAVAAK